MRDFESNHVIVRFIRITQKKPGFDAKSHKLMFRQNHAFTGFLANHTTSWLYEIMLLQDGPDWMHNNQH
jgi:hypothetical protein